MPRFSTIGREPNDSPDVAGNGFSSIILCACHLNADNQFGHAETGGAAFYDGGRTASGEVTGPGGYTAAHRTLPFGTRVLVTNLRNGRFVVVCIADRGPCGREWIIDLSRAAALELDMLAAGTVLVRVDVQ